MSFLSLSKDVAALAAGVIKKICLNKELSYRKAITKELFTKQYEQTEGEVVDALVPLFMEQVNSMTDKLLEMNNALLPDPPVMVSIILDPSEWEAEFKDALLPILALSMARAGITAFLTFGIDLKKYPRVFGTKETGSEWLDNEYEEFDELVGVVGSSSVGSAANVSFMQELPIWMKTDIVRELRASFAQDYWKSISITTGGDAEKILEQGLTEGWSIRRMAREMTGSLGGDSYARKRATRIARTESGNALNAIRKHSIDQLISEVGPAVPIQEVWLSVLADTTRDSHADLDGVPADTEGMWNLDGVRIPWPGHYTLPPQNRVHCLCSIVSELGMTNEEAQTLIADHEARLAEMQAEEIIE